MLNQVINDNFKYILIDGLNFETLSLPTTQLRHGARRSNGSNFSKNLIPAASASKESEDNCA